jgi:hypothetical protein
VHGEYNAQVDDSAIVVIQNDIAGLERVVTDAVGVPSHLEGLGNVTSDFHSDVFRESPLASHSLIKGVTGHIPERGVMLACGLAAVEHALDLRTPQRRDLRDGRVEGGDMPLIQRKAGLEHLEQHILPAGIAAKVDTPKRRLPSQTLNQETAELLGLRRR